MKPFCERMSVNACDGGLGVKGEAGRESTSQQQLLSYKWGGVAGNEQLHQSVTLQLTLSEDNLIRVNLVSDAG